jgi:uncharacterized membrane protein HdeD (DUF308 family)
MRSDAFTGDRSQPLWRKPHQTILVANWWSLLVRGILALLLGGIAIAWQRSDPNTFLTIFATYAFIDGLVVLAAALQSAEAGQRWWTLIAEGVTGVVTAILALTWSVISALHLVCAWAAVTGVLEILSALRLRRSVTGELLLVLSGVVSVVLAFLMAFLPLTDSVNIAFWTGLYALTFGVLLTVLGFRLRALVLS